MSQPAATPRPTFWTLVVRSLRLQCPLCGRGRLYGRWFRMHSACPQCEVKFEREAGFFLGSIYLNYGLTSLLVAIGYPLLRFRYGIDTRILIPLALAVVVIVPLLFFPHARALWLGFDQYCDPRHRDPLAEATRET